MKPYDNENCFLNPPWVEFPDYEPMCIGFRMGVGEDYMDKWKLFWNSLSEDAKNMYKQRFAPPKGWEMYYA